MHPSQPVRRSVLLAFLFAAAVGSACRDDDPSTTEVVRRAATVPTNFVDSTFVTGVSNPTAMAFAPDGRLFVCQQGGQLRVIKNGVLLGAPFLTVTVSSAGERGLLGIAFDPAFASNGFLYIYYTATSPTTHNRVSRFTASGDVAQAGSEFVVLNLNDLSAATNHNSGAVHFGMDGKLYVAAGENANSANAQTLSNLLGKLLRINADGSIPTDNPFFGTATGVNRAIWAMGLRNPFTFDIRRSTGTIFINDVGQSAWEEIDLGVAGANYGWPTTEGATTDSRFRTPLYSYDHGGGACAITGGAFYDPVTGQFPTSHVGKYFFADHCAGWIRELDPGNNTATTFATGLSSPVDLKVGPDGALYYLAHGPGAVGRISYAAAQAPTITSQPANLTRGVGQSATFSVAASGSQPLSYAWQRNSVGIAGASSPSYTLASVVAGDDGARFRVVVSNAFGTVTSNEAMLTVTNNAPPTVAITAPGGGSHYNAGDTVAFAGTGTDAEDGTLPPSSFTWRVDLHHDTHTHPFFPDTSGIKNGSVMIPRVGETSTNVWYRFHLTVVDSGGLQSTTFVDVLPNVSTINLATTPAGLQVTLDGQPLATPAAIGSVVGVTRTLGVVSPQSQGATNYSFSAWSDGEAAIHNINTPPTATTYTATFNTGGGGTGGAGGAFLESGGQVVMEAENATGTAPGSGVAPGESWSVVSPTPAGTSGAAIGALPSSGVNTADTTVGPRRDYAVQFTAAGTYYVWVRLIGATGGDDSVHAGLNGVATSFGGQGLSKTTAAWAWVGAVGAARVTVNVAAAGIATVNLWMREDGVQVDRLLLTRDATFTPSSVGPPESARDGGGGGSGGSGGGSGGAGGNGGAGGGPPPGTTFVENAGQVVMEAENSSGTAAGTGVAAGSAWTPTSPSTTPPTPPNTSGAALIATPSKGVNTTNTTIGPRRDYAVAFTNPGTYYVWLRMIGPTGTDDSVHVGLGGAAATLPTGVSSTTTTWTWANMANGARATVNVIAPGTMNVNLWMREDGVQVDRLLLTQDAALTPAGIGPAESPRR